jgi:hypothetical protein
MEEQELELVAQNRKSRDLHGHQLFDDKINNLSPAKVRNVITPRIVQIDTQACLSLLGKIDRDNNHKKLKEDMLKLSIDKQRKRFSS